MKKLVLLLLFLPVALFAQEEDPASLFQVVDLKVKKGMEDAFEAAVKSHNEQFHGADGLYAARLFYNINGPSGGMYTWVMGPTTYTALDDRPSGDEHDDNWGKVEEYVEEMGTPGFWNYDHKLSQWNAEMPNTKRLIWVYDIKRGQGKRWAQLVGQVKEVYEEKRADETFIVVWNDFADTHKGYDVAIIFAFDKWAWMDRESNFSKDYEEVHGEGSWRHFLNEFNDTINGRVDWLRTMVE